MSRWSPVGARRGVLPPEPGKKVTVSTAPLFLNVQKFSWFTAASKPLLVALAAGGRLIRMRSAVRRDSTRHVTGLTDLFLDSRLGCRSHLAPGGRYGTKPR